LGSVTKHEENMRRVNEIFPGVDILPNKIGIRYGRKLASFWKHGKKLKSVLPKASIFHSFYPCFSSFSRNFIPILTKTRLIPKKYP